MYINRPKLMTKTQIYTEAVACCFIFAVHKD